LVYWNLYAKKEKIKGDNFVGIDPSKKMLELARKKVKFAKFVEGKAQKLPIKDDSTEIISISYGIRNVVDRTDALKEFFRALKPNGIVVILEFTKREKKQKIDTIIDFGMKRILPFVGGLISKNYKAYKYLPNSIEDFPKRQTMLDRMQLTAV